MELPPDTQALIFDLDGTIADTMPLHYRAWVRAMGEYGHPFAEGVFYELAGVPTARIIEMLNDRHGWSIPVAEATDRKEQLYVELIPEVRQIEPVVSLVRAHAGQLPMAIATGGMRSVAAKTLAAVGLDGLFAHVVTADDVAHGKPAPDVFLRAAELLGAAPARCAAFEDAELGLQSARAAGMFVVDIRPLRR